jgi:oligopeptide transport system permease protein
MTDEQAVKGTSLWSDAFRRLLKNRAALVGGIIVALMAGTAGSAELISEYLTHYTQEETRNVYVTKPPGARSVPAVYKTFYDPTEYSFSFVDADKDGVLTAKEFTDALQRIEFMVIDTDGDGALSEEEFNDAPHGLVGVEGLYFVHDDEGNSTGAKTLDRSGPGGVGGPDGEIQIHETGQFTNVFPREEADSFVRQLDQDMDRLLTEAEFIGVPETHVHLLGCDNLGRDLLTRLIYGGRISLAVGLLATFVSFVIGVTWGATAGFMGGRVDNLMMRFVDVMYGLPFMFVVILLMVVFGKEIYLLFIALGAVQWLTMSRIVRGQVISLKNREFVEAARAIGVSKFMIIARHLIPNALGPIIVYSTLTVPAVMLEEAFLSFLGLGVQPPAASWGSLASEGRQYMEEFPWLILYPSLALAVTLLSLNFFGDGLRDALDPQLKKD